MNFLQLLIPVSCAIKLAKTNTSSTCNINLPPTHPYREPSIILEPQVQQQTQFSNSPLLRLLQASKDQPNSKSCSAPSMKTTKTTRGPCRFPALVLLSFHTVFVVYSRFGLQWKTGIGHDSSDANNMCLAVYGVVASNSGVLVSGFSGRGSVCNIIHTDTERTW